MPNDLYVHIRWMIRRDMSEILDIESASVEHPWSEDDFIRCLRQRNCIGIVAEHRDQVVGFMVYELDKTRLLITKCAVHPDYRGQGVGTQMVEKLIGKLSHQRRAGIVVEVRERNLAAQVFFRSLGFRASLVLRDFYPGTVEDAYLMAYRLDRPVPDPLRRPRFTLGIRAKGAL